MTKPAKIARIILSFCQFSGIVTLFDKFTLTFDTFYL